MKMYVTLVMVAALSLAAPGCKPNLEPNPELGGSPAVDSSDPVAAALAASEEDGDVQDKPYLLASQDFVKAIAARDYSKAWDQLSSHAQGSMMPVQFDQSGEEATPETLKPIPEPSKERFIEWMGKVEQIYGAPKYLEHLYVNELDPAILSGKEGGFDRMLAIGFMPESIPTDIRKASLRGSFKCQMNEEQAKEFAEEYGLSVEQVMSGKVPSEEAQSALEEFSPYFNTKFVLVEEGGALKVGYFEFMPPSMLD